MGLTNQQYDQAIQACKEIFLKKTGDYGTSWRVLRIISVADQLFIKAQRVRILQQKTEQRVGDDRTSEFIGMVNYGVIGLIQLSIHDDSREELPVKEVEKRYDENIALAKLDHAGQEPRLWRGLEGNEPGELCGLHPHEAAAYPSDPGE